MPDSTLIASFDNSMAAKIFHPLLALIASATNSAHVVSMMAATRHADAAGPCRGGQLQF